MADQDRQSIEQLLIDQQLIIQALIEVNYADLKTQQTVIESLLKQMELLAHSMAGLLGVEQMPSTD